MTAKSDRIAQRDVTNMLDGLLERYCGALDRLVHWGVRVAPTSRLRRYEERLAGILEDPAPILSVPEGLAHNVMFDLREIDELCEIVESFDAAPGSSALERLRLLPAGSEGPDAEKNAFARDAQFELLVRSVLRRGGLAASISDPDLLIELDGRQYRLEAKRPKNQRRVDDRLRKAVSQLKDYPGSLV